MPGPDTVHRAVCEITELEYNQLWEKTNERGGAPPALEILTANGHRIDENHIGRIGADAWAFASGRETGDREQQNLESDALSWTIDQKVKFLVEAGRHWLPPMDEEMSHWGGTLEEASSFVALHPALERSLGPVNDTTTAGQARSMLVLMDTMETKPYDSTDWQDAWNSIHKFMQSLATRPREQNEDAILRDAVMDITYTVQADGNGPEESTLTIDQGPGPKARTSLRASELTRILEEAGKLL